MFPQGIPLFSILEFIILIIKTSNIEKSAKPLLVTIHIATGTESAVTASRIIATVHIIMRVNVAVESDISAIHVRTIIVAAHLYRVSPNILIIFFLCLHYSFGTIRHYSLLNIFCNSKDRLEIYS